MIAKETFCNCQCGNNATIKHEVVYLAHFSEVQCKSAGWGLWGFITECWTTNQHFIASEIY